jgi:glucose/arabinose dehydrogenase
MRLLAGLAASLLALRGQEPSEVKAGGKGLKMDYGPFLTSTVSRVKYKTDADLLAYKGISIKVAPEATVCFDPDLLRMAGGWTGGFLDYTSTHLTSYKGSLPTTMQGALRFSTPALPGGAIDGTFKDPRPVPFGPLPGGVARWNGLYVHKDRVVLCYAFGGRSVLETPGYESGCFTRTFRVGPSKQPLAILAAQAQGAMEAWVAQPASASPASVKAADGRILVHVPPSEAPVLFTLGLGGLAEDRKKALGRLDPSELCKGGPARWAPLETKGALGLGAGPYVVDTLTLPEANPWNAWLRLTAVDFFADGRAAFCTWNGDVWTVSGIDETLAKLTYRRFAAGLYEPLGLRVVEDSIYVLGRDQITRLHDLNGDGEADFYENFNNAFINMASYHDFTFELHTDPEGNFYYTRCGHRVESSVPLHGCLVKVSKDGSRHEIVATGFRAPNGLSVGPGGEITCSDNQGNWCPASRLNWVKKGGFYGYVPHSGTKEPPLDYEKPLCWIPQALDNSSGGQVWVTSDAWGPFKGKLLHTSYGTASLFHVPYEIVDGQAQGGVVKFPLSFASGIMRGRFHPKDGQLYLAGLRGWQTTGVRDGCLQRVRYTGKPVHLVLGWRVTKTGVSLEFPNPLDRESATDPDAWGALWWNYLWSDKYGSPDYSVENPKKQTRDTVEIRSVTLSEDGRTVTLGIPGMRPVMQLLIKGRVKAADGAPVPVEFYGTVNRIP